MSTLVQASLFDAPEEPVQTLSDDPTREQLMEALERLHNAVESVSGLPDEIYDVGSLGVVSLTSRENYICKGYSYRQMSSNLELARMIFEMRFKAIMPHAQDSWQSHMQARLDRTILESSTQVMNAYYQHHPAIEDKPRWQSF